MTAQPSASSGFTPRLASSIRWTELPADFKTKILAVFTTQFPREAQLGEFLIDGRIYPEEVVMRAGYLENGRLRQINFEVSVDLPKAGSTVEKAFAASLDENADEASDEPTEETTESRTMSRVYLAIDALGSLMEEYFQAGSADEMDLPLRWREFDFEGDRIYLQHSTVNTRLEEEADRLLRAADPSFANDDEGLLHETKATDDALANAEIDEELAFEIQKAIRSGKFPQAPLKAFDDDGDSEGSELN